MEARGITDEDLAARPGFHKHVFHAPKGDEDRVLDADVLMGRGVDGYPSILIPWIVTEQEKEALANGGTLWLRIIGTGMPPVALFVEE
jgi:hypothetical protein